MIPGILVFLLYLNLEKKIASEKNVFFCCEVIILYDIIELAKPKSFYNKRIKRNNKTMV